MTTFSNSPKPTSSPWGHIQGAKEIFPGVWNVSTPGHGGLILSAERMAAMPAALKCNVYGRGNAFEEDCEWALVAAAFPEEFAGYAPGAMKHVGPTLDGDCYRKAHDYWLLLEQTNADAEVQS